MRMNSRSIFATAAVLGSLALVPTASAKSCSTPPYPGNGYFTSLTVKGTSCAAGKSLMKAHYRARIKHGKKGHAGSVKGYHCTEKRNTISTEYNSRVTCKNGSRKVVFTY